MNPKTILVVEDSATMRLLLSVNLKKLKGCQVVEACEGKDAVEKLARRSFDLVITDINMPGMNGLELVDHIRGVLKLSLPVVIVTTKGEEGARDIGMQKGASAYLTKPISGEALVRLVESLLSDVVRA